MRVRFIIQQSVSKYELFAVEPVNPNTDGNSVCPTTGNCYVPEIANVTGWRMVGPQRHLGMSVISLFPTVTVLCGWNNRSCILVFGFDIFYKIVTALLAHF